MPKVSPLSSTALSRRDWGPRIERQGKYKDPVFPRVSYRGVTELGSQSLEGGGGHSGFQLRLLAWVTLGCPFPLPASVLPWGRRVYPSG